ncbi:MAG: hypothetical protein FD130_225, partial [Halothiobacillaceae bacterium]
PPLLANLSALTQLTLTKPSVLPLPLSSALAQLVKALPTPESLTRAGGIGVKQSLQGAGLTLEGKLLQLIQKGQTTPLTGTASIDNDFKANLLKLLNELQALAKNSTSLPLDTRGSTAVPLRGAPIPPPPHHSTALAHAALTSPVTTPRSAATLSKSELPPLLPPFKEVTLQPQARQQASIDTVTATLQLITDELITQVEGSLSRLRSTQLANVPSDPPQNINITAEIPVRRENGIDLVQLRIAEEREGPKKGAHHGWRVTLTFDFEELGPIYANVTLSANRVNATLNALHAETTALIEQHLSKLCGSFTRAGLTVGEVHCQQGKPSQHPQTTTLSRHLLDTQA